MNDEDYVAAVLNGLKEARSRAMAFHEAVRQAMEADPISDAVTATFDEDGYLRDLFIDPTASAKYTHTELEELITAVLRDGSVRLREAVQTAIEHHFGPGSAWREMDVAADEW